MIHQLGLHAAAAGGTGLTPGWRAKILQIGAKKKKKQQTNKNHTEKQNSKTFLISIFQWEVFKVQYFAQSSFGNLKGTVQRMSWNWRRLFSYGISLVAQTIKNPPVMQETWVQSLGWEDSPGKGNGYPLQYSCLHMYVKWNLPSKNCKLNRVPRNKNFNTESGFQLIQFSVSPMAISNSCRTGN